MKTLNRITPYQADLHQWALDTAQAIQARQFEAIEWDKVTEELRALAGSEEQQLESRLTQLIYHLLKMEYQTERHGTSWDRSVKAQRHRIYRLLQKEPSLKHYLQQPSTLESAYSDVLPEGTRENLPNTVLDHFPDECPYTLEMLLPELKD